MSVVCVAFLNLAQDLKLARAAEQINSQHVEKFAGNKTRRKSFKVSTWGSIKAGDVIRIKRDQEIPCDCLILNIAGSRLEHQTCYEVNSLWHDTP